MIEGNFLDFFNIQKLISDRVCTANMFVLSFHHLTIKIWNQSFFNAFQSVTKNLSLGTEAFWLGQQRKSGVGVVARYDTKKMVSFFVCNFKLYMIRCNLLWSFRFSSVIVDLLTHRNPSLSVSRDNSYLKRPQVCRFSIYSRLRARLEQLLPAPAPAPAV